MILPDLDASLLTTRLTSLRRQLQGLQPERAALQTGSLWLPDRATRGEFQLALWGRTVRLLFPQLTAWETSGNQQLSPAEEYILLSYFRTCDGTPQAGRWDIFPATLESGLDEAAFQRHTGQALQNAFGNDNNGFQFAAEQAGGRREFFGNLAYSFQALPRLTLLVACWLGSEETPASYRLLFDAAARHQLPAEACALLGIQITRRLIRLYNLYRAQAASDSGEL